LGCMLGGALLGMCNLGEGSWKNGPRTKQLNPEPLEALFFNFWHRRRGYDSCDHWKPNFSKLWMNPPQHIQVCF
jgi:hypothetical protein